MKKLYFLFCITTLAFCSLFDPGDQLTNSSISLGRNPASPAFFNKNFVTLGSSLAGYLQQNSKKLDDQSYTGEDVQAKTLGHYSFSSAYNFAANYWLGLQYSFETINFDRAIFKNDQDDKDWYEYFNTAEISRTALNFSWLPFPDLALGLSVQSNYFAQHYEFYYSSLYQDLYDTAAAQKSVEYATKPYGSVSLGLIKEISSIFCISLVQEINYDTIYIHYADPSDDDYTSDQTNKLANVSGLGLILRPDPTLSLAATLEWSHQLIYNKDYKNSREDSYEYYNIRNFPYNTYGLALAWEITPQLEWQLMGSIVRNYQRNENMDTEILSYGSQVSKFGTELGFKFSENQNLQIGFSKYVRIQERESESKDKNIISNSNLYFNYGYYFAGQKIEETKKMPLGDLISPPTPSVAEEQPTTSIVALTGVSANTANKESAETPGDIIYKLSATEIARGDKLSLHVLFKKGQQVENGFFALAELSPQKFLRMSDWFYTAEIAIPADLPAGPAKLKAVFLVNGRPVEKEFSLNIN